MNTPHQDVLIILDRQNRVLMHANNLPSIKQPFHFWQTCEPIHDALAQWGLVADTIRVWQTDWHESATTFTTLMCYRSGTIPDDMTWVKEADAPPIAQQAMAWLRTMHPQRVGWYMPQFMPEVMTLMQSILGNDVHLTQVRCWGRSSIVRIQANQQIFYLKHVPPMFAHEPALSASLAQAFPHQVPAIMHYQAGEWLLMEDYQGVSLFDASQRTLSLWARAVREFAQLQQVTRSFAEEATQDRRLPVRDSVWMKAHYLRMLSDDEALARGYRPLTETERAELRQAIPRIEQAFACLDAVSLEPMLTHGDLWAGQIVLTQDDHLLFTDWSDSALSHPFFDMVFFLAEIAHDLPDEPQAHETLLHHYLSQWTMFGSLADGMALYRECAILAPLYTALRYYVDILPMMEVGWEMENMLAYHVRGCLQALAKLG